MKTYLAAFSIAVVTSLILTRLVREWAIRRGLVDRPEPSRKLHSTPIPRVGGIAIYLSLLISLGIVCLLPSVVVNQLRENLVEAITLLGLAGLMLLVGVWDDFRHLAPWTKLSAQILVALACWAVGFRILGAWAGSGTVFHLGLLSLPVTVIWIVGVTNAFNLIDGIDGLSSGAALLAMLTLLVVSIVNNQPLSPLILSALAGATLGFLRYNFHPASIFLGDSGSLLLGFSLALVAVKHSEKSTTAVAIAVPVVAFGLPVLDMAIVIVRRFLSGRPIFLADRRHIHHVLMTQGLKPRHVVILLYGCCGLFGLFSLLFLNPSGKTVGLALAILGMCIWFGIQHLHYPELRELNGYIARGIQHQRKLITGSVKVGLMLDGFRSARSLSDLLLSLSLLLEEMDFTRAEVRLPSSSGNRVVLRTRDWRTICDGHSHCIYRWSSPHSPIPNRSQGILSLGEPKRHVPEKNFRIEFVFRVRPPSGYEAVIDLLEGQDIGRLTFFHSAESEFPASAICLLSRNIWQEFGNAVSRIMARPISGQDDGYDGSIPAVESSTSTLRSASA